VPTLIEQKAALAGKIDGGVLAAEDDGRTFTIIASVTNVVDEVDDIVVPGAYKRTLGIRRPKIIKDHDWAQRLGKTLEIAELMPGDPRLPKTTPSGQPWPTEAGALIAKVRLFTDAAGKAAAERWHEYGADQAYSIGYVARKALKGKDGVRKLIDLDLFEISDVLFGAMPICGPLPEALAVKMLPAVAAVRDEQASLGLLDDEETESATEPDEETDLHVAGVDGIDWAAVDAAVAGVGTPEDVRVAVKAYTTAPEDARPLLRTHLAAAAVALGQPSLVPGSWRREAKAAGGADRNRGNAEKLRRWYVHGGGAAKIRWGTEGDFMRCVRIAGKHMTPERAKGYCNLRHQDAVGAPPGQGHPGDGKKILPLATPRDGESPIEAIARAIGEAKALPKTQKCRYCDQQATKRLMWAEGMAYIAVCDDHEADGREKIEVDNSDEVTDVVAIEDVPEGKGAEPMAGRGVMIALYPPREVAEKLAIPDGNPADVLHVTLGYLGQADDLPDGAVLDLIDLVRAATAGQPTLAGTVGGLGEFPAGPDGKPVYVPVDVPGLSRLRERIAAVLTVGGLPPFSDHGFTPHLTLGYNVAAKPVKPVDVTFDAVWVVAGDERVAVPLGDDDSEGKAMYDPKLETGDYAGATEAKHLDRLDGTYEDRIRNVRDAIQAALRPPELVNVAPGAAAVPSYYINVVGTYDDRMIVTRCIYSDGVDREETYEVPYMWDPENGASLGEPREVRLQVDVEPVDGGDVDEVIANPAMDALGDAAYAVKVLAHMETKAGRVLSGANEARLRAAVEHLISVLEAAGVRIGEHADESPLPAVNATTPDTTSPTVLSEKALPPDPLAYAASLRAFGGGDG
jgi:2'-5' RNA ligase